MIYYIKALKQIQVSITATIKTFTQRIADTIMHSTANIEEIHIIGKKYDTSTYLLKTHFYA